MSEIRYPIGIQSFTRLRESGYVYVDKTDMVYSLTHSSKIAFLSRPRRFGKSLLLSTIQAYFEGKKELFAGLKIESLEKEWLPYKVFRLDFNGIDRNIPNALHAKLNGYLSCWEAEFGISEIPDINPASRFAQIIKRAAEQTGRNVVVLVDEYDKPLLDELELDKEKLKAHRETLKAFYTVFKLADEYLQFVFLTGVTKFSQVSVFSGFNQADDLSMVPKYDAICGITNEELAKYFTQSLAELAQALGCSKEQVIGRLKEQYDGYHFSYSMRDVYNPFSLLKAFQHNNINNYWADSGSPSYLIRLLNKCNESIDQLAGRYFPSESFITANANNEYPLPMLYQSGYLTIKDYDSRRNRFLLDFPNNEVKSSFLSGVVNSYFQIQDKAKILAEDLSFALSNGDLAEFFQQLTAFMASIPYSMRRKADEVERERYFQYTFYLILRLLSSFNIKLEQQQSEGRVDCIVETNEYVYIFEFKLDGSAQQALQQIKDKGYARSYLADQRTLFKVGVNFSSQTGTIAQWLHER